MTDTAAHPRSVAQQDGVTQQLVLGARVSASDGCCGELRRLVFAPDSMVVTHLVVGARHHRTGGHLVPIDLVAYVQGDIMLRCTLSDLTDLADAETTEVYPARTSGWAGMGAMGVDTRPYIVIRDRLTYGDVEITIGDRVLATDGDVGRVGGLVTRSDDDHVTHLVLDQRHGWGRREVWIPVDAVVKVETGVQLSLSRDNVRQLPARTSQTDHRDHKDAVGQEVPHILATMTVLP